MADSRLTHVDEAGRVRMVDVSGKEVTDRLARARGEILMQADTVRLITGNRIAKGNVIETARLAGIMAAKRTADLIPLCHPLNLTAIDLEFEIAEDRVRVSAEARISARTGVEMEALTSVTAALLTIYDMCKAVDRGMVLSEVRLVEKQGGSRSYPGSGTSPGS
jgi:cyclic pyranopterin phosphate synthase